MQCEFHRQRIEHAVPYPFLHICACIHIRSSPIISPHGYTREVCRYFCTSNVRRTMTSLVTSMLRLRRVSNILLVTGSYPHPSEYLWLKPLILKECCTIFILGCSVTLRFPRRSSLLIPSDYRAAPCVLGMLDSPQVRLAF